MMDGPEKIKEKDESDDDIDNPFQRVQNRMFANRNRQIDKRNGLRQRCNHPLQKIDELID